MELLISCISFLMAFFTSPTEICENMTRSGGLPGEPMVELEFTQDLAIFCHGHMEKELTNWWGEKATARKEPAWKRGMTVEESRNFHSCVSNVYFCGSGQEFRDLADFAKLAGRDDLVRVWVREEGLYHLNTRHCEGCFSPYAVVGNPALGYALLLEAKTSKKELQAAAQQIAESYLQAFRLEEEDCFSTGDYLHDTDDLSECMKWYREAGWSGEKIKKQLQKLVSELKSEDQGREQVKEAVLAVEAELAKL